jgi:hypothetical protein
MISAALSTTAILILASGTVGDPSAILMGVQSKEEPSTLLALISGHLDLAASLRSQVNRLAGR